METIIYELEYIVNAGIQKQYYTAQDSTKNKSETWTIINLTAPDVDAIYIVDSRSQTAGL